MFSLFVRVVVGVCLLGSLIVFQSSACAQDVGNAQNVAGVQNVANTAKSFSIVLLPDTQNYSEKYPDTYIAQALWIRKQAKQDNIKFAIHL